MKRRGPLIIAVVVLFLLAAGIYGYRYWYDSEHYVRTDNAYVTGSLVQVTSPVPGRLTALDAEVGRRVAEGEVLARVTAPVVSSLPGSSATSTRFYPATNLTGEAVAPITGLVVALPAAVGDTLAAGQPVATLVDPASLWVVANVDETKVGRVKPGQPVEVHVDMLGETLPGTVEAITPAAAALFSFLPAQNANGNFTKVSQVVPVKIAVDYGGRTIYPGTSVSVSIRVKD
jgi:multidrug resistance efflux pump